MIKLRKSSDRGHLNHGWLDTYHTFSFGEYLDPKYMGFRSLRVINEDIVEAGQGFPTHGHRDMEIITYVLDGAVAHKDSMGNSSTIRPGDVQRMSAGTGVRHSEFNPLSDKALHLMQIWILPEKDGLEPGYEQKMFSREEKLNRLRLVASNKPQNGAVKIHQDAELYIGVFEKGKSADYSLKKNRGAWLQIAHGSVDLNGTLLNAGDGAAVENEAALKITAREESEVLLFDLF